MSALSDSPGQPAGFGSRALRDLLAEADPRSVRAWNFWEDWISFALLAVAQFSVAFSIARANWVNEMPSLPVAAGVGLVTGTLLARFGRRPWASFLGGGAFGGAIATAMVLHTMELSDPFAPGLGIATRWGDLWGRMGDWLTALVTGGVSTDPLPFVLLLVFAVWLVPYLASWAVFRWRNAWLALLPGGFALLTNISYLPGKPALEFVVFLFAAILLFTRIHLLRTVSNWQGQRDRHASMALAPGAARGRVGRGRADPLGLDRAGRRWLGACRRGLEQRDPPDHGPRRAVGPDVHRDRWQARPVDPPVRGLPAAAGQRQSRGRDDVHRLRRARQSRVPALERLRPLRARRLAALRHRTRRPAGDHRRGGALRDSRDARAAAPPRGCRGPRRVAAQRPAATRRRRAAGNRRGGRVPDRRVGQRRDWAATERSRRERRQLHLGGLDLRGRRR